VIKRNGTQSGLSYNECAVREKTGRYHRQSDVERGMIYLGEDVQKHFREMEELTSLTCPFLDCPLAVKDFGKLQEHLLKKHNKQFCDVCWNYQQLFVSEHELFDSARLDVHKGRVASSSSSKKMQSVMECDRKQKGIDNHPICNLCGLCAYDAYHLDGHKRKEHLSCPMCPASSNQEFFKTMEERDYHIQRQHEVCTTCLKSRPRPALNPFINVFNTKDELDIHVKECHPQRQQSEVRGAGWCSQELRISVAEVGGSSASSINSQWPSIGASNASSRASGSFAAAATASSASVASNPPGYQQQQQSSSATAFSSDPAFPNMSHLVQISYRTTSKHTRDVLKAVQDMFEKSSEVRKSPVHFINTTIKTTTKHMHTHIHTHIRTVQIIYKNRCVYDDSLRLWKGHLSSQATMRTLTCNSQALKRPLLQ